MRSRLAVRSRDHDGQRSHTAIRNSVNYHELVVSARCCLYIYVLFYTNSLLLFYGFCVLYWYKFCYFSFFCVLKFLFLRQEIERSSWISTTKQPFKMTTRRSICFYNIFWRFWDKIKQNQTKQKTQMSFTSTTLSGKTRIFATQNSLQSFSGCCRVLYKQSGYRVFRRWQMLRMQTKSRRQ